jgi:hypothetical protein
MNDEFGFFRCGSRWPFAFVTVRMLRERRDAEERRDDAREWLRRVEPDTDAGPRADIPHSEGISQLPREVALNDFSRDARARDDGRAIACCLLGTRQLLPTLLLVVRKRQSCARGGGAMTAVDRASESTMWLAA